MLSVKDVKTSLGTSEYTGGENVRLLTLFEQRAILWEARSPPIFSWWVVHWMLLIEFLGQAIVVNGFEVGNTAVGIIIDDGLVSFNLSQPGK